MTHKTTIQKKKNKHVTIIHIHMTKIEKVPYKGEKKNSNMQPTPTINVTEIEKVLH
jgi:hypothetical protein